MGTHSVNKQVNDSTTTDTTIHPMVTFVVAEFERYEKAHADRFKMAAEIIDDWNNKPPQKTFDWMNAVHVPITFASEQTITPRIFSALFPTDAPIDVAVFGISTEQGIPIKTALQHAFKQADVQGEGVQALTQNTLIGTGYVEAPYLYRKGWVTDRMGNRNFVVVDRRPDCKSVNFFEMYPHPAKIAVDDGLPLIRRRYCDAEYLKKMFGTPGGKCENLQEALNSKRPMNQMSQVSSDPTPNYDPKNREQYELLEYWGNWDESYLKDDGTVAKREAVPYWITVVNRTVKFKGIPNPYNFQHAPYAKFNLFSEAQPSWFGVGIGQAGKPTQERLNKIVNQRLDNVDLVLNKQGAYNGNDPLINTKKLQISKPGQWHKVSDPINSLKWMDTPDVTASSYKEEELAKGDYREATGASAPLMPTDKNQHETAAGLNMLQGAAGIRFRPVLKKIEQDFIVAVARMFLSHMQQFMVLPEWMMLTTDDGRSEPILVRPEELQAQTKIMATGISETLNKETQIAQLLRFKEISVNDPTINQAELNKEIAGLMGFKDIHKFIVVQQPIRMGGGMPSAEEQMIIQKRLAEGASPEQIKLELLGQPPAANPTSQSGQGSGPDQPSPAPRGQQAGPGSGAQQPMTPMGGMNMVRK